MKRFILQTFCFFLLLSALLAILHEILYATRWRALKLPDNITTFYVGNSTIEESVNDELLPGSLNLGRYGEPISMTYAKIKSFTEVNPQIDTVVISFDDTILFKDELTYPDNNFLFFIGQFSLSDWLTNIKYLPLEKSAYSLTHLYNGGMLRIIAQNSISTPNIENYGIGGFNKLKRNELQKDIQRRRTNPSVPENADAWSGYQKYYLDKIVEYLKEKEITLVFLTTPKHREVWDQRAYKEIHSHYYSGIPLWDYTEYYLPDSCFADCYHLNFDGANYFTPNLIEK